jgi:MoaA/NifB/PqqE/SkfB family radical SAM enzyme|tara:strand:+ start:1426 stop:2529 length:1104 start_codon:yes stop_codon:yes gene_type:complete
MINKHKLLKNIYFNKSPVSLILFLTNRCNARCPFCFIDFDNETTQNKDNELTADNYLSIAKNLKNSLIHLNITGGEPFLRSDLGEIVENFINYCDLNSIIFSTNGSYPKKISSFIDNVSKKYEKTKFIFQFSIDSFPKIHDEIRKIPGLFNKTLESYNLVKNSFKNCIATCNLTVSENNCDKIEKIYYFLTNECKIETINPIIVRDEGVYKISNTTKEKILSAYKILTNLILKDVKRKKIRGFSNFFLEGEILNSKNEISYDMIINSYIKPQFYTPCVAGKIFGVIKSNGDVFPCEILDESKIMDNLKDYNFNFLKLWLAKKNDGVRKWIKDTKCNCHWECIYIYNLISNKKYLSKILTRVLSNKLN